MTERIIIKKFSCIDNLNAEFKQINIFIGPQASGKSITVKLLFFFKNIFSEVVKSVIDDEDKRLFKRKQIDKFETFFPKESWGKHNFNIQYFLNNNIFINIEKSQNGNLKLTFSNELDKVITKAKNLYKTSKHQNTSDDIDEPTYIRDIRNRQEIEDFIFNSFEPSNNQNSKKYCGRQLFIPAGRSFFANLQSNIFSFLSDNQTLDPFIIEFGSMYESFKRIMNAPIGKVKKSSDIDDIENLISNILGSDYLREKNKDFLVHKDDRKINIVNASSGQQETLPLLIILKLLLNDEIRLGRTPNQTIYIEEPEAHLFPSAQNSIVKLLSRLCNQDIGNYQIFITTHSPYVLSSFNNLFYAGNICSNKSQDVFKVIDKEEILSIDRVAAYSLIKGECTNILNSETRLINETILDEVSGTIGDEFDKLLDLEYGGE